MAKGESNMTGHSMHVWIYTPEIGQVTGNSDICSYMDAQAGRISALEAEVADLLAERERLQALLTEVVAWRDCAVGLCPQPHTDAETLGERLRTALRIPEPESVDETRATE